MNSCLSVRRKPNLLVSGFYPQLGFLQIFFYLSLISPGGSYIKMGGKGGGGFGAASYGIFDL